MEDREEALDFIYKGWREGRQQRRNLVRQRGLDRTRAMLEPILAQRARGSMASMPPSMPIMPVEEATPVVPEQAPSMGEVAETVSSPPKPANDMTNDIMDPNDHPDDATGAFPGPHNNFQRDNPEARAAAGFETRRPAALPSPEPQPVQPYAGPEEEERRIQQAKDKAAEARRTYSFEGAEYDADSPSGRVLQAVEESVERRKEAQPPTEREEPIERPKSPPPEEQTPVKEEEKPPEHEAAFEPAFNEMVEEATTPKEAEVEKPVETTKPKKRATKKKPSETTEKKPKSAKKVVEQTKKTPKPKPAKAVVEATKPKKSNDGFMDSAEGENPKAPYVKVGKKYVNQMTATKMVREGTHKWSKRTADGRATLQEVKGSKKKTTAKKTTTKKPAKAKDPVVQAAAKKDKDAKEAKKPAAKKEPKSTDEKPEPIKPKGKASDEGKERARRASDGLAAIGMGDSPPKEEESPKKKTNRKTQDLKGITKPDQYDLRRSADQQMLADVLLKKLPVADLKMFQQATGIRDIAPLLDDKGFMTQVVGVEPSHVRMMGLSDTPTFNYPVQSAVGLDLNWLKFDNAFTGFPQARKPHIEDLYMPPMKTIRVLDEEGKPIQQRHEPGGLPKTERVKQYNPATKKVEWVNRPIYEVEEVEDEDIGYFIRDGNERRRMTKKEAQEIKGRKGSSSGFKGPERMDFATPYFDPITGFWQLPMIEAKGKPSTLPKSPWNDFSFINKRPYDGATIPQVKIPELNNMTEIAAFSPKELKARFKELNPKENPLTRIGDSAYQTEYLKDLVSGMTPSNMTDEDIRFSSNANYPLQTEGRGVVRYDEEPSYWKHFLAPYQDPNNDNVWESMNDLFE